MVTIQIERWVTVKQVTDHEVIKLKSPTRSGWTHGAVNDVGNYVCLMRRDEEGKWRYEITGAAGSHTLGPPRVCGIYDD